MHSITYGEVNFDQMCDLIGHYIQNDRKANYDICVGTDSQNTDITKVVLAIAIRKIGSGGIFFIDIQKVKRISNLKQKLYYETAQSLDLALKLNNFLLENHFPQKINIHVDAGAIGASSEVSPQLKGWIIASGFGCQVKPFSYAASSIADKFSK